MELLLAGIPAQGREHYARIVQQEIDFSAVLLNVVDELLHCCQV